MSLGPALLLLALATGLVLRLAPVLVSDFPLGDGGLFVTMAHDIRDAGFALPQFSTFNYGDVPFAYPPIGLYVLALIPGDPILTERWLPLVWSVLAIVPAYLLVRELMDETHAGIAALIFSAMPLVWAIEGGGVTRALALALLLSALWRTTVLLRAPTVRNWVLVGVLVGLAILAHPAVGPAGTASAALLLLWRPSRAALLALVGAAAVATLLILPWVLLVVSRYGIGSVIAAGTAHHGGETLGRFLTVGPSGIGPLDFVLAPAVIGIIAAVRKREWLMPAWVVLLIIVPGGEGRYAAVVWAGLAAAGVMTVRPAIQAIGAQRLASTMGFSWLFVAALLASYPHFQAVPKNVRDAMIRAGQEVPAGTRFAVVSDDSVPEVAVLDWFPTLSRRTSVGTPMGLEWTTSERWETAVDLLHEIQDGHVPPEADAIFRVRNGVATWEYVKE